TKAAKTKTEKPKLEVVKPSKAREIIPVTNPTKLFLEVWQPKNESFFAGIKKLFTDYAVPGNTDKQREANSAEIIEKIEAGLRKEPISQDMLEQLLERFPADRAHKIVSIMSMKPRTT